jgi:hypothetical protein
MSFVAVLDIVVNGLILIGVWYAGRSYKGWIPYGFGCVGFFFLGAVIGRPGMMGLGVITTVLAVKNYKKGKRAFEDEEQ